jgi:hypothetical protein
MPSVLAVQVQVWKGHMSSFMAAYLQIREKCTSLLVAESLELWKNYTSFVVDVDDTALMSRAMEWWHEKAMFYYARARWIIFIIVLAYWTTITV